MSEDKIKFSVPVTLIKSEGVINKDWCLYGRAGDSREDRDGEYLDYSDNFDISKMYYVNWEHSSKPSDIIGIVKSAEIKEGAIHVKTKLNKSNANAKDVWNLAKFLDDEGKSLQFSVEGKVLERDPANPKRVTKAELYGVALCKVGVNERTFAQILKSMEGKEDTEEEEGEMEEKAMDTESIAPATKEDLDGKTRKLKKSEIYLEINKSITTDPILATEIYNLIFNMEPEVTQETVEKARQLLNLAKSESTDPAKEESAKATESEDSIEKSIAAKEAELAELKKAQAAQEKPENINKGVDVDILKSEMINAYNQGMEDLKKSVQEMVASATIIAKSETDELKKSVDKLDKENEGLRTFMNEMNKRLGTVESTPLEKSVTNGNAPVKERFQGGETGISLSTKEGKSQIAKSIVASPNANESLLNIASKLELNAGLDPTEVEILRQNNFNVIQ